MLVCQLGRDPSAWSSVRETNLVQESLLCSLLRAFGPPRMRFPFYIAVMEVLAGLPLSLFRPLRWLSVDWTDILTAITSGNDEEKQ